MLSLCSAAYAASFASVAATSVRVLRLKTAAAGVSARQEGKQRRTDVFHLLQIVVEGFGTRKLLLAPVVAAYECCQSRARHGEREEAHMEVTRRRSLFWSPKSIAGGVLLQNRRAARTGNGRAED